MSQMDLRKDCEKHLKKILHKYRRDAKLEELESQLQFAESRCGTLKQQLDYIKRLYKYKRNGELEKGSSREGGYGDGSVMQQFSRDEPSQWINQNQSDCGEPFLKKETSHSNTASTISSQNKPNRRGSVKGKKITPKQKTNLKILKIKKKCCKKIKKGRKMDETTSSKVSNASSQTHNQICPDAVVEIYKNMAVNAESESGLELFRRDKILKPNDSSNPRKSSKSGNGKKPAETREDIKAKSFNCLSSEKDTKSFRQEGIQTDLSELNKIVSQKEQIESAQLSHGEFAALKTEGDLLESPKSYSRPTIASRRKQVERDIYLNLTNLNIRNIPFVAARSTAPSHNIGVNIQQVLSIIKKRRPISEYVLGLNANRSQDDPAPTLPDSRKVGGTNESVSAPATEISSCWELKKRNDRPRSSLSYWKSNSEVSKASGASNGSPEAGNTEWSLQLERLKTVLVFLHEDFSALSRKYKRLQKKLTKRNISKTDAKGELSHIERDLEKKEEEIIVVTTLYKEVLNLREEVKKLRERYDLVTSGGKSLLDGLRHSNSAHAQMASLLRKIQNFQSRLKP